MSSRRAAHYKYTDIQPITSLSKMACPFLDNPVDIGARIVRVSLRRARVFEDRCNPLDRSDDYLYERYRFSSEGIIYLCQLLDDNIRRPTRRCNPLTTCQAVCLTLRYLASGSFMYSVGDAENLSKNTVCRTVRQVVVSLTRLLNAFVVFPGHLPMQTIKEGFYQLAGKYLVYVNTAIAQAYIAYK